MTATDRVTRLVLPPGDPGLLKGITLTADELLQGVREQLVAFRLREETAARLLSEFPGRRARVGGAVMR